MKITDTLAPADALWRAMPPTRMLDCGMIYADVLALRQATDAGTSWDDAAKDLATAHLARADAARTAGHTITAIEAYRAAAADLLFAQMAHDFDTPRKIELYTRFTSAIAAAGALRTPAWERVELPFASGRLFGWLVRPAGPATGTVIIFGGQSGWGAAYQRQAEALAARGVAALLAEGPGQGEARWRGGVMLDADVRAAYSTFVSHVRDRTALGSGVGLWGNSLGGLYAATTAASDPRVSAVCVNGAPARPRLLDFRTFVQQAAAMLGTTDPDEIQRNFDRLALAPTDRITCPLLVLHGGQDPIITLADQQPFLDAAGDDATMHTWDDGEHTIYNHADERTAFVADWFADRLARTKE
ncbi:alpha/beta hydrolase [Actinomadura macra]|uniref:alpha/beta hydrolase n=1 Tax=Actinomadura macra TaxID=46164 RepID=UPI000AA41FF8|nr:alpha/beta hydrolase [Actinomadura macra]